MARHALVLDGVSRAYANGVRALGPVDLVVPRGRFLAVMGRSGSGKSTLLQCAAGLDRPTGGSVRIAGTDLGGLKETALTRLRRERIGFVFQAHNLVPSLTVAENVALPLLLAGGRVPDAPVREALAVVGLAGRAADTPGRLSGGQQQRVAVARALVTAPEIVFADEPTGALDPLTAQDVLALLRRAVDDDGRTVVMVTHDPAAAAWADSVLFLAEGLVADTLEAPDARTVLRIMRGLAEAEKAVERAAA
ncbi:ABC transporter ATP-binding protein [Streptomyces niveus]|uniref:ABC transporter ATP-binding protein n=1 Tax=Streptomyces niveus TaxID=193462 RepID=UPI003445CDA7